MANSAAVGVIGIPDQTGNNGKYLKTDGAAVSFDQLDISTADVSGILPVANGGTGVGTITGLVKGNGTGNMSAAVAGTDYQAPLVSGTNIKTINSTSLVGSGDVVISTGLSSVTSSSSAVDITLTNSSNGYQQITMTAFGKSVILPSVSTFSTLGIKFNIINSGNIPFKVKNAGGKCLFWIKPLSSADCVLLSTSVELGGWRVSSGDYESDIGLTKWGIPSLSEATSSSSYNIAGTSAVNLSENLSVIECMRNGSYRANLVVRIKGGGCWASDTISTAGICPGSSSNTIFAVTKSNQYFRIEPMNHTNVYLVTATGSPISSLSLTTTVSPSGFSTLQDIYTHSEGITVVAGAATTTTRPSLCMITGVDAASTPGTIATLSVGTDGSTKGIWTVLLTATSGVMVSYCYTTDTLYFKRFTISGNSISFDGTTRTISSILMSSVNTRGFCQLVKHNNSTALFVFNHEDGSNSKTGAVKISDSGSDITISTTYLYDPYLFNLDFLHNLAHRIGNKILLVFNRSGGHWISKTYQTLYLDNTLTPRLGEIIYPQNVRPSSSINADSCCGGIFSNCGVFSDIDVASDATASNTVFNRIVNSYLITEAE